MTKQEAIDLAIHFANEKYGKEGTIEYILSHEAEIIEDEEIWYIPFTEKEVEHRKVWGGAYKGLIIDKKTGEYSQPGSAYVLEKWIWGFKLGFRDKRLDLTILEVSDMDISVQMLYNLVLQYVKPELDQGVIWKIPKAFSKKEIRERLSQLPCTFKNQGLTIALDSIEMIIKRNAFQFEVHPTDYAYKNIYGELRDEEGLIKDVDPF